MSELKNRQSNCSDFRKHLLVTASAVALLSAAYGSNPAKADDPGADRPVLWIELGGQLSRLDDEQEAFAPVFSDSPPRPAIFSPSAKFDHLPLYSIDETGKVSFEPDSSNWVLSASVRYGRSASDKHVRQHTNPKADVYYEVGQRYAKYPVASKFADTNAQTGETHFILDFQAGKDVGLGMFGSKGGSSVFSAGVRFAQFSSKSNIALESDPDWHFSYKTLYGHVVPYQPFHNNVAGIIATRSFHGVGPSLSWNASAPFMGSPQNSELTFDWGLNASFLFGRQHAEVHHHMTEQYHPIGKYYVNCPGCRQAISQPPPVNLARSHTVTVPNIGGFAGLSFRYASARISAGYRADFFWGAMDGGIDARKNEDVGFYGPFASISVVL